ncbi:DNA-(apurinic or apyrimidinic site) lyase 2 [Tanacetum coccineum]
MASSSSSSFQVLNHQLCQCDLPVRVLTSRKPTNPARRFIVCQNRNKPNATKKCGLWDWFDEELESDWYRLQLNEMYYQLNPNQRRFLENEMTREERIRHLQQEVNHGLTRLTFWKSVIFW